MLFFTYRFGFTQRGLQNEVKFCGWRKNCCNVWKIRYDESFDIHLEVAVVRRCSQADPGFRDAGSTAGTIITLLQNLLFRMISYFHLSVLVLLVNNSSCFVFLKGVYKAPTKCSVIFANVIFLDCMECRRPITPILAALYWLSVQSRSGSD